MRLDAGGVGSLFPFLSVLASLVGALSLIIVTVILAAVSDDTSGPGDDPLAQAGRRIFTAQHELRDLDAKLAAAASRRADVEQERARLRTLLATHAQEQAASLRATSTLSLLRDLRSRRDRLSAELAELEQAGNALIGRLPPAPAPRPQPRVELLPSGSGRDLDPVFVECTASALMFHGDEKAAPVRAVDIPHSDTLAQLLKRVRASVHGTVIFLVRPDGVATFRTVEAVARSLAVRHGKLPVPGTGRLDLSAFGKGK